MKLAQSFFNKILPISSNRRSLFRSIWSIRTKPQLFFNHFNYNAFRIFKNYANLRFNCNICGKASKTLYDFPDLKLRNLHRIKVLRETLQCNNCFCSMRDRALANQFITEINLRKSKDFSSILSISQKSNFFKGIKILNTDKFSMMSNLLVNNEDYIRSFYDPESDFGETTSRNLFNLDLENILFEDRSFDIVLTSDVMEHVRDYKKAHSEIHRILKKGGLYIFTIPYDETLNENLILVDSLSDKDVFLVDPQYHGDPMDSDKGVLSYRVFGKSIIQELNNIGFETEFYEINNFNNGIFSGDVFCARKQF